MGVRPVFNAELGKHFSALREARGWTQRQATEIALRRRIPGVSRQTIWRVEAGKVKHPEAATLRGLAALYEASFDDFVARYIEAQYGVKLVPAKPGDRKPLPGPVVVPFDAEERKMLDQYRRLPAELRRAVAVFMRQVADGGVEGQRQPRRKREVRENEDSGT